MEDNQHAPVGTGAVITPVPPASVRAGDQNGETSDPPARKRERRRPGPKPVPHLTTAERAARGRAARATAPRSGHGDWEPASDRRDVVELLEEQAASRVPELVPIRYGRMLGVAVHVLPRRGLPDGGRSGRRAPIGAARCSSAATRTCRTSVASPRPIGGWCSTSTTSTRRCRARSSGTSSGWRRASPSPAAIAASTREAAARRSTRARRRARTARRCASFAGMRNLDVWYARIDVDEITAGGCSARQPRSSAKQFERNVAKAALEGQHEGVREADRRSSTASARIVGDPPLIVPIEDVACRRRAGRARGRDARCHPLATGGRCAPTAGGCSSGTATSHAARKVVGVGSVGTRAWIVLHARPRRRAIRCSSSSRRRRRRCSSRSSARARSPTTASGSSRASG